MYIVELEKGVWLASGQGDPARTLKIENAKRYKRENWARYGLKMARNYRPFEKAKIKRVDDGGIKNKIMTKEQEFIKELTELMEKHDIQMYIEIDQDYAGVQGAELRFDTKETCSNLIFTGWDRTVDAEMVRAEVNEA